MRSIFYVAFVAVLIGAGFYFKIVTLDPLSIVIIAMLLWNSAVSNQRQAELARLQAKSHEIVVANQKLILKAIENVNYSVRKLIK